MAFEPTTKRELRLMEHCLFYYIICCNVFRLLLLFFDERVSIDDDHSVNICCLCSNDWNKSLSVRCVLFENCLDNFRLIFSLFAVSLFSGCLNVCIFTSYSKLMVFYAITDEVSMTVYRISCKQNYER